MNRGAFVQASIDERKAAAAAAVQRSSDKRRAATAWVAENCPDLIDEKGGTCWFAVAAALDLKSRGVPITPAAVRKRRANWRLPSGRLFADLEVEIQAEQGRTP